MSRRFAVVSIGTNSTRLLVADVEPEEPRVMLARSIGTRIGEGLDTSGALGEVPMQRTCDALEGLMRAARGHYVRLFAIATSALRRAVNGDAFAKRVRGLLGVPLRVLTGEEEARASYRGALTALDPLRGERVGVLDLGGGSTEFASGLDVQPDAVLSCEIGAVRLTEAVPELDGLHGAPAPASIERARTLAREGLAPLRDCARAARLAMVGGSATTTASLVRGRRAMLPDTPLDRADLARVLAQLTGLELDARRALPGMKAQRADILPAGIILLDTALDLLGHTRAVATTADLLLGVLLEARPAPSATFTGTAFKHART